jgi:hypothetical protein
VGHEVNGLVTKSEITEVCAHDSIAGTALSPSALIPGSVKSYLWSVPNGSWKSGGPNQCARAGTRAITGDEGDHTSLEYQLPDLHGGTYEAAMAHERDDHLFSGGPDWVDLVRLLFESFEITVIDFADDINEYSAFAIRFMNRNGRGHAAAFGQHD